ncbi:MAG TPA: S41 family peptidase [Candidatus Woesebacteria bacterium]|nr:S41 family peptidase [Candidatus Woesebacteria bacterium]HPJ17190.1 S41 family peptidase [Candidatus Woesebacteria bacterium]
MNQRSIRNLFLVLALLTVTSLVSFKIGQNSSNVSIDSSSKLDLSLMWQVKNKLEETFLEKDKIIDKDLVYGAIEGMVGALGDPYTVFLPPKENQSSNEDLAGEFGGVGIQLGYKDKNLAVMTPIAKTPADKAGLQANDLILKIIDKDKKVDRDTTGISLDEAVGLIRGKVGTEVTLKIYRESKKDTFEVTLKRDNIVVPSIELVWVERNNKKIAWIRLYKFTERLYTEWPEIVSKITKEKGNNFGGIVLDLRNNPGGFLQASVMVASDFIKSGVIVSQESADGTKEDYPVMKGRGNLLKDRLVILVNEGSASASEILAGALKDFERGKLVGEKTFGKGTVQQPEDFKDGSGLHITVARWLLPSGKNIHKVGVDPDVTVKYEPPKEGEKVEENRIDNQVEAAIKELLN